MSLSELAVCPGRREGTVGRPQDVGGDSGRGKRGRWERAARSAAQDEGRVFCAVDAWPLLGSCPGTRGDGQEGGQTPSRCFRRQGQGRVAAGSLEEPAPAVRRTAAGRRRPDRPLWPPAVPRASGGPCQRLHKLFRFFLRTQEFPSVPCSWHGTEFRCLTVRIVESCGPQSATSAHVSLHRRRCHPGPRPPTPVTPTTIHCGKLLPRRCHRPPSAGRHLAAHQGCAAARTRLTGSGLKCIE